MLDKMEEEKIPIRVRGLSKRFIAKTNPMGWKNPFVSSLKIEMRRVPMENMFTIDEVGDKFPASYWAETDKAIKLYDSAARRKHISSLSLRGGQLFLYCLYRTEVKSDLVFIDRKSYMIEHDIRSNDTYKSAEKDLISNGIISPSIILGVFFVNPHFFFKGSRPKKYPSNVNKVE
jgi:hypothetical protein